MKITDNISTNLAAWMKATPSLNTLKKVEQKSKVAYSTIRRSRNGDGNPTILNLYDIAHAFGRQVEDLLAPPKENRNIVAFKVADDNTVIYLPIMREMLPFVDAMSEQGQWQLLGMAKALAHEYPRQKNSAAQ